MILQHPNATLMRVPNGDPTGIPWGFHRPYMTLPWDIYAIVGFPSGPPRGFHGAYMALSRDFHRASMELDLFPWDLL